MAGLDEAKEECMEFVSFLQSPDRYKKVRRRRRERGDGDRNRRMAEFG